MDCVRPSCLSDPVTNSRVGWCLCFFDSGPLPVFAQVSVCRCPDLESRSLSVCSHGEETYFDGETDVPGFLPQLVLHPTMEIVQFPFYKSDRVRFFLLTLTSPKTLTRTIYRPSAPTPLTGDHDHPSCRSQCVGPLRLNR